MRSPEGSTWLHERSSGVLAHVSSLPGDYGIGNLGAPASSFIDFLADAGFRYWQICPLGPTGYGDSPYQSFSSFAGNPYFIDLGQLVPSGLLKRYELETLNSLPQHFVDYGWLYHEFWPVLRTAWQRFSSSGKDSFEGHSFSAFCKQHKDWLDAYAVFMALKAQHGGCSWTEWEDAYRHFDELDLSALPEEVLEQAAAERFYQFLFFMQWNKLRAYAQRKNIRIIGDLPIYISHDSADAWQFRKVFRMDADGQPEAVAGVPPDYFSASGQLWGNPLYDWDYLKSTNYAWWVKRLGFAFQCCDVLRLDHFRAFDTYWEIPAPAEDASKGSMREGPGTDFFDKVAGQLESVPIIAEDLGYITEGVVRLRKAAGLPGMKILQFGYGHDDNNVNLPHFYPQDSVVYTGTHDNDTTRGWLSALSGPDADKVRRYYRLQPGDNSAWPMIEAGFACVSKLAVFPLQDLFDLGSEARFNRPGTLGGNWIWRFSRDQLLQLRNTSAQRLRALHELYDRTGDTRQREYSAPPESPSASHH